MLCHALATDANLSNVSLVCRSLVPDYGSCRQVVRDSSGTKSYPSRQPRGCLRLGLTYVLPFPFDCWYNKRVPVYLFLDLQSARRAALPYLPVT
jgi:hypothetical protein